jgi:hypothetical protein
MSRRRIVGLGELAVMAWTAIAAMGALAGLPAPAPAASSSCPRPLRGKGGGVLALARYVEWPSRRAPAGSPFVVGVLGDDGFRRALEQALAARRSPAAAFACAVSQSR